MMTSALDSYLAVRRAAGFQLRKVERYLRSFVLFSSNENKAYVCTQTAIEWARQASSPPQRSFRLKTVVAFARYLFAEDSRHEVPPDDFFGGYQIRRRTPFIFTIADINQLVETASRLGPPGYLRRHTYSTLFALLSVTGLRVSEALNLRFENVTPEGLWIRNTKFSKSRFIPLHPTAVVGLEKYLVQRRRVGGADGHVFISIRGQQLSYSVVQYQFRKLVRALEFHTRPGQPHPRIHSLRHSFATRALESCPEGRDAIARHTVALATYLGHSDVRNTYWYLEATPQLLADISSACERFVRGGAL
jgi:integrase/recombinase XerD